MAFDGDVGVVLGQDFSSFALVIEVTIVVLRCWLNRRIHPVSPAPRVSVGVCMADSVAIKHGRKRTSTTTTIINGKNVVDFRARQVG
jgi:hypothetical protein